MEPLRRLVDLMPELRVALVLGKDAQAGWTLLFERAHGRLLAARSIRALHTYHPSRQALWSPDPAERTRREDDIRRTLQDAAASSQHAPEPRTPTRPLPVARCPRSRAT
ncbi:MAG: hypothetical protein ABT15_30765 [Pseudonocardia sp. SCN 73-27]|nr:MAG: hypothetical protein ABS80_08165 [Pseudonocardia sp. SCN 72-51]ODU99858.1 MAG: hypothetical protein ABT15_30765 [Pseudonocardia sp. SCN 73-27]